MITLGDERTAYSADALSERPAEHEASVERDAERYRWLRTHIGGEELERITGRWPMSNDECDSAIDGASGYHDKAEAK